MCPHFSIRMSLCTHTHTSLSLSLSTYAHTCIRINQPIHQSVNQPVSYIHILAVPARNKISIVAQGGIRQLCEAMARHRADAEVNMQATVRVPKCVLPGMYMYLALSVSICLSMYLSICPFTYVLTYVSIYLSVYLSIT